MWYEILPSAALVFGFLSVPAIAYPLVNYFKFNGKLRARFWDIDPYDFHLYLRDQRLTGSEYVPQGLETIPDVTPEN